MIKLLINYFQQAIIVFIEAMDYSVFCSCEQKLTDEAAF